MDCDHADYWNKNFKQGPGTPTPMPQRQSGRWQRRYYILLPVAFFLLYILLFYWTFSQTLIGGPLGYASVQSGLSSSIRKDVRICPSALPLFDNATELRLAIDNNIQYHQRGGNLASIEKYLNNNMQYALDYLNVQFTPNGASSPIRNAIDYLNDYPKKNSVKRGGYGQPLPGSLSSAMYRPNIIKEAMFEKRWINVIEPPKHDRFNAGMGPVGPDCSRRVTFSDGTNEEKNLCVSQKMTKVNAGQRGGKQQQVTESVDCNVISIGSNDQWGFEEEVMQKLSGCVTHTFDCTLNDNTPSNKPQSDDVKFYPYCIGSTNAQPPYLTYERIWNAMQVHATKRTKKSPPPTLLKMDIEGFEYDVIQSILSSDSSIWPEQIMMEVHWATRMVALPWMPRTRTAAEIALFFSTLFNFGGYIVVHSTTFTGCEACMEVLLVRAVC